MEDVFLFSLAGTQYGIRKEDVASIRDLEALHRIPFSPAGIAGIMIDGDRTVMLGHLAGAVGVESPREIQDGCILLKKGDDGTGFVVSGVLRTQTVPPEMIFRLPDCLKTRAFDACAIHGGIPIPLVNLGALRGPELPLGQRETRFSLETAAPRTHDVSSIAKFRFVTIGSELFALPSSDPETKAAKPGAITPLPGMPDYVKGVTFCDGQLLPIIDLSQRIARRNSAQDRLMLMTRLGEATFGLLVDGDAGTVSRQDTRVAPLPFIAQTAWMEYAVVHAGRLIPMIDLCTALRQEPSGSQAPACKHYTPDSPFSEKFFRHEIDVVEFSLLGERCALPKVEVEDIIPFRRCRALPGAPHIVTGVVEHNAEILPVIDLATMFGRSSRTTPSSRMMLVRNGNFRALVITDEVNETKRLPPDTHRSVPLNLPYGLTYGCYPDGKAARIILNVRAIAVYFEKPLARQFTPALSHDMKIFEAGATCTPANGERRYAAESETLCPGAAMGETLTKPTHETSLPPHPARAMQSGPANPGWTAMTGSHSTDGEPERARIETDTLTMFTPQEIGAMQSASTLAEGPHGKATVKADRRQAHPDRDFWPGADPAPLPAGVADQALDKAHLSKGVSAHIPNAESGHVSQEKTGADPLAHLGQQPWSESSTLNKKGAAWLRLRWRRMACAAIAAAPVALLFYFAGNLIPGAADINPTQRTPNLATAQSVASLPAKHLVLPHSEEITLTAQATRANDSGPVLELVIPSHMRGIDLNEYVVVQGDTLWSISLRFTGSPYNYPRVAGQNRIADPDLIFPCQRIKFIK